jgi:hypothetical protein
MGAFLADTIASGRRLGLPARQKRMDMAEKDGAQRSRRR